MVPLEDGLSKALASQMFRCLSNPDRLVRDVVLDQLRQATTARTTTSNPQRHNMENFLNSQVQVGERKRRDVNSLWSDVCKVLQHLKLRVNLTNLDEVTLEDQKDLILNKRGLTKYLKTHFKKTRLEDMLHNGMFSNSHPCPLLAIFGYRLEVLICRIQIRIESTV